MKKESSIIVNKELDPDILKRIIRKNWIFPVLITSLFLVGAFLYLRYTKPVFESVSIIQLDDDDTGKDVLNFENITNEQNLNKYIELLRSQFLFEKAVSSLNMNVSHYSKGEILTEEKYLQSSFNVTTYSLYDSSLCNVPINVSFENEQVKLNYNHQGIAKTALLNLGEEFKNDDFHIAIKSSKLEAFKNEAEDNELYFTFNNIETLTNRLLPNLIVYPVNNEAKTIHVSYKSNNPALSHDIVNAVNNSFFNYDDQFKQESSEKILAFINNQLDSLSKELRNSKDSITGYKRKINSPNPFTLEGDINQKMSALETQLFELDNEMRLLNNISKRVNSNPQRMEIYRIIPQLMDKSFESSLSMQINELHSLLETKEDLQYNVSDEHEEIITINAKIDNKIYIIRKSIEAIEERLKTNSKFLKEELTKLGGEYLALPEKQMELSRLSNLQKINEEFYTLFTEKQVVYSISNAGYTSKNKVLNKPTFPTAPISPNKKVIYGAFFLFGLFIGIVYLIYKYVSYNEVNTLDDLKKLLPEIVGVLGTVPLSNQSMEYSQLVVSTAPKSAMAESMRNIRTNLNFIHSDAKTIAISSSVSGEGKTFVALNLAGIIAMSGKKTIIVDLDLRKPKIHLGLNAENKNGVSKILIGKETVEECIQHSSLENLDFITAGPIPPNPSELILSQKFADFISELKTKYDTIIIDNPPVGLVSDGVNVLFNSDIPIYVFKANYSKRNFVNRVKELVEVQKVKKLNVILNGVHKSKNGYGYGYGYNGYYEENNTSKNIIKRALKR